MKATRVRHQPIADECRANPGQWEPVRAYPARYVALSMARSIRVASLPAYQPEGAFDAEVRTDQDGDAVVWARYVAQEGPNP
jgi:hypothetical protein